MIVFDVVTVGGVVDVAHSSGNESFTVAAGRSNLYEIAEDLAVWLADGARAWAGALTSLTWSVVDGGDGRVEVAFAPVGTTFLGVTVDPEIAHVRVSIGAVGDGIGEASVASLTRSTTPWERWDMEGASRCRAASWRVGHPVATHRRPAVELGLDLAQSWALSEACRLAAQPRRSYLYDEQSETWRRVTVGRIEQRPHVTDDPTRFLATIEVLG